MRNCYASKIHAKKIFALLAACSILLIILLPSASVSAESAESLTTGLVGSWNFNEGSGTMAADNTGSGFDIPLINMSEDSWSDDVPGCIDNDFSLSFDGVDDHVGGGSDPAFENDSATISLWFKANSVSNFELASYADAPEGYEGYGLGINDDFPYFYSSGAVDGDPSDILPGVDFTISANIGKWVHLTGTYDSVSDDSNLYINGSLVATENSSYDLRYSAEPLLYIGVGPIGEYFDGNIDDVRVYNRALSSAEVLQLSQTGCVVETVPAEDNDGISIAEEDAAPNNGDANNDGIPDSQQAKVTSLLNSKTGKYVVLETNGTCSNNNSVVIESETTVTSKDDDDFDYPAGLIDFSLIGCGVGSTETITQYYFGDYDVSKFVARKYNKTNDTYSDIEDAILSAVSIGGEPAIKVVYSATDGGVLDQDGNANGTIVDPIGLGVKVLASTGRPAYQSIVLGIVVILTTLMLTHRPYQDR